MNKKLLRVFVVLAFIGVGCLINQNNAWASESLTQISSATYDGENGDDWIYGAAVDSNDNIIVIGKSKSEVCDSFSNPYDDYFTIKYDNDLTVISSATYNGGNYSQGRAVAVDSEDNIIVTGYNSDTTDAEYFTIKYDNDLNVISSTTYNGVSYDYAYAVTVDSEDNIIVTGARHNGADNDYFTIKYSSDLTTIISSATYANASDYNDYAEAVTVDSENNIIVTGRSDNGSDYDYFTIKYSSGLTTVKSSATYANAGGNEDQAHSVAVDSEDNIIVTGYSNNGINDDFFTIKYDSDLVEISSVSYNGGDADEAQAVTVDSEDNIIVTGRRYDGTDDDFFTIKYDSALVKISSASYDGGRDDVAYAVVVDSQDNIFAAGKSENEDDDYLVLKYTGLPEISAISPSSGRQGESVDLTVTGINFYEASEVNFSGSGITVNSSVVSGNNSIEANISIAENASLGFRDISVSNAPDAVALITGAFEVTAAEAYMELTAGDVKVQGGDNGYVNPAIGEKAKIHFNSKDSGTVQIKIYTSRGQLVWEEEKRIDTGPDHMEWNCRNTNNTMVSSGVYIIYITAPGIEKTKKVAVVK